jgi:hypothetical protein
MEGFIILWLEQRLATVNSARFVLAKHCDLCAVARTDEIMQRHNLPVASL